MEFNFCDTTYAALLGLFAAILGIGYPLIIQAMGEIDKKYGSARILAYFEKNAIYLNFIRIVRIGIFVMFVTPFVLYLSNDLKWLQVAILACDAIFVLKLMIASMRLYGLIQKYYNPQKLYQLLVEAKNSCREVMDLAIYAAKNEDLGLYNGCIGRISQFLSISEHKPNSEEIKEITQTFLSISSRIDAPDFMKSNALGIDLYFAQSLLRYDLMWSVLRKQINNGNFDWIMNYWERADQYFTYTLTSQKDCYNEKELCRFKEFHIALCALLLYNGKFDWLKQIMRFTNQLPPRYELVPCSFTEIFDWLKHFNRQLYNIREHLYLEMHYPFTDHGGVQADQIIYSNIVRYLAYRMLFLDEIDYNVRYMDPMEPPLPCVRDDEKTGEKVIPTNRKNIDLARQLLSYVKKANRTLNRPEVIINNVENVINNFIATCEDAIKAVRENPEVSAEKVDLLKNQLQEEFNRQKEKLIIKNNIKYNSGSAEKSTDEQTAKCEVKIDRSDIYKGDFRYSVNLESVIISSLMTQIQNVYNRLFLFNHTTDSYTIRYIDIERALHRLELSNDFVVIGMGIELQHKYVSKISADIKDTIGRTPEIVVMKKTISPYVSLCKAQGSLDDCAPIMSNNDCVLYTNLEKIKSLKNMTLKVMIKYKLITPVPNIKYIRLRIFNGVTDKTFDLDRIMPACNCLL